MLSVLAEHQADAYLTAHQAAKYLYGSDGKVEAFRKLRSGFKGKRIVGVGFDQDVLIEAGIEHADAFAAVSSGDNSNVIAARVVRESFGVGRVADVREVSSGREVRIETSDALGPYIAEKGSIAVDGVSLTVTDVAEGRFGVKKTAQDILPPVTGA